MFINFTPLNNEIIYVIKSSHFNYFYNTIFPTIKSNFTILYTEDVVNPLTT